MTKDPHTQEQLLEYHVDRDEHGYPEMVPNRACPTCLELMPDSYLDTWDLEEIPPKPHPGAREIAKEEVYTATFNQVFEDWYQDHVQGIEPQEVGCIKAIAHSAFQTGLLCALTMIRDILRAEQPTGILEEEV